MSKRNRIQFGLRKMLVAFAAVAIGIVVTQWLQTDTIIYFDKSCTVRLPDGQRVRTNHWFKRLEPKNWGTYGNDHVLCEFEESDNPTFAVIEHDGQEHLAAVVAWTIRLPDRRAEYWIRAGDRVAKPTNE